MAITTITASTRFIGASTDTKPTTNVFPGSTFYEYDTGKHYICTGTAWTLK